MGIFIWEKKTERDVEWRWVGAFFLFCLFVSCFQAFVDEHHNSSLLISEKSQLVSDKYALQSKLDAKQQEVDYLRDHQQVRVEGGNALDPRVATILDRLNRENLSLKNNPSVMWAITQPTDCTWWGAFEENGRCEITITFPDIKDQVKCEQVRPNTFKCSWRKP